MSTGRAAPGAARLSRYGAASSALNVGANSPMLGSGYLALRDLTAAPKLANSAKFALDSCIILS
jgi:hypothetical protein